MATCKYIDREFTVCNGFLISSLNSQYYLLIQFIYIHAWKFSSYQLDSVQLIMFILFFLIMKLNIYCHTEYNYRFGWSTMEKI